VEFFLIRHTAPAVAKGVCYGQADVPLAETAEWDIQAALAPLPKFDRVYSSPAQRCLRLATALAQRDAVALVLAPELQELNFGDWERLPWAQIPREHSDPWAEDTWNRAPPGGETEQALWTRVASWYLKAASSPVPRCAVVAHAGSLRQLRCLILSLPIEARWSWSLNWGGHARFEPV
jgi:alpha-ribazole phosphatase